MKLPETGELWAPAPGDLTKQGLDDYRTSLELAGFDVPNLNGTEIEFRLAAVDKMLAPVFYNQAIRSDASDERFAKGGDLDEIRERAMLPVIPATPSEGPVVVKIVGATPLTFADGLEGKLSTGQLVRVKGNHFGIENDGIVTVYSSSTGEATNAPEGTKGKWTAPPLNVVTEFTVGTGGLIDGGDEEKDEEKRERIQIKRMSRSNVLAENWGALAQVAREAHPSIQAAFVYPCLGGPASAKVVVTGKRYRSNSYGREVSDSVLDKVRSHVRSRFFSMSEIMVQTADELKIDMSVGITFSNSGNLWMGDKWPRPAVGQAYVNVTSMSDTRHIRLGKISMLAEAPTVGSTVYISWWCAPRRTLVTSRAVYSPYDVNNIQITTDVPLSVDGIDIEVGSVIFPSPVNAEAYTLAIDEMFEKLGPGENTAAPTVLNANPYRGYRLPRPTDIYPAKVSASALKNFEAKFAEVANVTVLHMTPYYEPPVPGTPDSKPYMLQLEQLGIYPEG